MRLGQWIEEGLYDVKFALRQLAAAPVFTAIAATDAGARHRRQQRHLRAGRRDAAAAAAVRRRRIGWSRSGKRPRRNPRGFASPPNMLDWNARSRTFETIAGFTPNVGGMVMAGRDGNAETVSRQWVTAGIFDVLGVKPIAGRTFSRRRRSATRQRRRAERGASGRRASTAIPSIVGSEIKLDGMLWTVVGVVPKELRDPRPDQRCGRCGRSVNLPPRARGAYHAAGRRPDEAGRRPRGRAGRSVGGRRRPGARVPADQHGPRRPARADARHDDRQRSQADVDAVPRRRRLRAADLLRERRQPAAGARHARGRASWRCARRSAPAAAASSVSC